MSVELTDMIEQVRVDSGLRSNPLFSDAQIIKLLTKGQAKLRDIFIASFAHWFRKSYRFTLAGGVGGNTLDLTLIPDLQMDQYLNRNPDSATPEPVTRLGSLAERTFGNGIPPGWVGGRKYETDGDVLTVYPVNNSSGDYELVYTSMGLDFALPVTKTFSLDNFDIPEVPPPGDLAGEGAWLLANADADETVPSDGGFDLDLTFTTTNLGFSGTYHIVSVGIPPTFGSPTFGASNLTSTAGFTSPPTGSGAYTYQPVGTIDHLPQVLTPWADYVILYACIKIRQSRKQPTGDLITLFTQEEGRATKMAKTRTEGTKQAPMTHNRMRRRGYSYGAP